MLPLTMASQGEPMTIKKIGGKQETKKFLETLGFVVGGTVTVVSEINGKIPELPLEKIWQIRLWFKAMFQH